MSAPCEGMAVGYYEDAGVVELLVLLIAAVVVGAIVVWRDLALIAYDRLVVQPGLEVWL